MRTQQQKLIELLDHQPTNSVSGFELTKAKGAIEQFIYSCSHTLRAPLKSIAGLVYLLKNSQGQEDLDPKVFLDSIEKTVIKMELLLNELETFLSNSRESIAVRPVDVKDVLDEVLNQFQSDLKKEKIHVKIENHQPVFLFSDQNRLQVILSHLLANTIQFCDKTKQKKEIRIRTRVTFRYCKIQIRDNGIGIESDVLPNIFDLFFRGSEKSTGSGVGLYVVKEVINKMGGCIKVRSTINKGTTFLISIPNLNL